MKIIFASSEIVPFASTGGLGDVCSALPKALVQEGVDVIRMLPLYQEIDREKYGLIQCKGELHIPLGPQWFFGRVWTQESDGVRTYFIQSDEFFERAGLYGSADHGYSDNFERFLFFQKAVVKLIDMWNMKPDIVHCNDWQTGLIPMLLRCGIDGTYRNGEEKTVFTIHNLAHQGWAPAEKFYMTQLPHSYYTPHTLEFYNEINSLKGGLVGATAINAVSPTYAKEISTERFGCRLEGVLQQKQNVLSGILNGIDYTVWDPSHDEYLAANYTVNDLSGKVRCKAALQKKCGFKAGAAVPLFGVITRLVPQKGIDLLADTIDAIIAMGAQVVILGSGADQYEEECLGWAAQWPDQVAAWIEFSHEKAHQIEAGSDMFLMPSEFEPCGQNQLYSMRYGTIPIVHAVGGLEDSVVDYAQTGATGFKFNEYSSEAFLKAIQRALNIYGNAAKWKTLVRRAMKQDFSVVHMAKDYIALYNKILSKNDSVD